MRQHSGPRAHYHRLELRPVENAMVDAPRQRIGKKRGAGNLGQIIGPRIEKPAAPESIPALNRGDPVGHLFVLSDVLAPARIVVRQDLQHLGKGAHDPTIASRPKDLLAILLLLRKVTAVTEVEVLRRVVQTS